MLLALTAACTFLSLISAVAVPGIGAEPDGPHTATDSMVYIRTTDADQTQNSCIGVCIAPGQVLVSARAIDQATTATATLITCEQFDIEGILAVDEQADLAILKIPVGPDLLKPLTAAQVTPATGIPVVVDMVIRIEGCWGMVARLKPKPVLSTREWSGLGVQMRLDIRGALLVPGSPVFDMAGQLCGLACYGAGNNKVFAVPVTQAGLPKAGELIPLATHAAREPSPEVRARRLYLSAAAKITEGRYAEAIPLLEQGRDLAPRDWNILQQLAVCLDNTGRREPALLLLQKAVEIEPGYGESWYSLGLVLLKLDRHAEAVEAFREALKVDPDYARVHGMLAVSLFKAGDLPGAIASSDEAIRLEPDRMVHYQNLATFLDQSGREHEVMEVWRRFCQANPKDGEGWSKLAARQISLDLNEEAVGSLEKAAELLPDDFRLHLRLAVCACEAGQFDLAERACSRARALKPTDPTALRLSELVAEERAKAGR